VADRDAASDPEIKTKEFFIQAATTTLNEASRISPSYMPLFLARGVLSLLRASIQVPAKNVPTSQENSERSETLRQALKSFEDAYRLSKQRNVMALLGIARVMFSMARYPDALKKYQTVLERAPYMNDPDPRIGIGCCLWQLGHREDARVAWQRALEVNPNSKYANMLMAIYLLRHSAQFSTTDPEFIEAYKKAMTVYTQKAFKLDDKMPLACSTFGSFFLARKAWAQVDKLARTAIEFTDVNAVASDGWYLMARKEHQLGDSEKAAEYYIKADQARGGDDKGYLPAKFGAAQVGVIRNDTEGAKFRLEKLVAQTKTIEGMTLLGTLYTQSVVDTKITAANKEEIAGQRKKAITYLEQVRAAWKDPKKKMAVDASVLLMLARLYEPDAPEKSMQCLKEVEQIELDAIPAHLRPEGIEDEAELRRLLREQIPPPLLNNIGCFYFQTDKLADAREMFQAALKSCVRIAGLDPEADDDAFVTTISYNLGRTYEAEGQFDEAEKIYEGLLARHSAYADALARLAYIAYKRNGDTGAKQMKEMLERDPSNLDVRALYGWFLNRTKRRTPIFAEDVEQRHNKHSLIDYDKHDTYVYTSMGNICLAIAREMRSDKDREPRRRNYDKAVEFFERALSFDPRNAYAAQGIAIALAEDRHDLATAVQILTSVRETMRDGTVHLNLGHAFTELKQFNRAIEHYESALAPGSRDRVSEPSVLAALGRAWYYKGRTEKSLPALNECLQYSQRLLSAAAPERPSHLVFNVAFVQMHIAQLICTVPPRERKLADVEAALAGVNAAVDAFFEVAKSTTPPYPRADIEQRANMARNTVAKQAERAANEQREYEQSNHERLEKARREMAALERERERAREEAERARLAEEARVRAEREEDMRHDRELLEARAREEEADAGSSGSAGERKWRRAAKARKVADRPRKAARKRASDDENGGGGGGIVSDGHLSEGEGQAPRKRRRVASGGAKAGAGKFKSAATVESSDDESMPDASPSRASSQALSTPASSPRSGGGGGGGGGAVRGRRVTKRVVTDDDEE
jgi:RNA polymerase-associated protein CTR9